MKLATAIQYIERGAALAHAYAKFYFGRNWWAMLHIVHEESADTWFTGQLQSVFGVPLSTFFFRVAGPFETQEDAQAWIAQRVMQRQPCRVVASRAATKAPPQ